MKHRIVWALLAVEACACVLLQILQASLSSVFSAAMAFPLEQVGYLLRALSLSGWAGNLGALFLYAIISLLPAAALIALAVRRKARREDGLLALLSVTLFPVLYLMINPGLISTLFRGVALSVGKAVLGGGVYSVLCGYLILRVLRLFFDGSTEKLLKYMAGLLILLNFVFVYLAFGACFGSALSSISGLRAGNTGNEQLLGGSYVFLILQYAVDALPYVLNVFVVFAALRLLNQLRLNRYSAESVAAANRLTKLCASALAAVILTNISYNLLQLLFAKALMVIHGSVQIPVLSIAFVLGVLLVSKFIAENKQLKDDNELFI